MNHAIVGPVHTNDSGGFKAMIQNELMKGFKPIGSVFAPKGIQVFSILVKSVNVVGRVAVGYEDITIFRHIRTSQANERFPVLPLAFEVVGYGGCGNFQNRFTLEGHFQDFSSSHADSINKFLCAFGSNNKTMKIARSVRDVSLPGSIITIHLKARLGIAYTNKQVTVRACRYVSVHIPELFLARS